MLEIGNIIKEHLDVKMLKSKKKKKKYKVLLDYYGTLFNLKEGFKKSEVVKEAIGKQKRSFKKI